MYPMPLSNKCLYAYGHFFSKYEHHMLTYWFLMFHDILLVQGSTIMSATPEYKRNRLARAARLNAERAVPIEHIKI